jgi:hypothetical protein
MLLAGKFLESFRNPILGQAVVVEEIVRDNEVTVGVAQI